MRFSYWPSPGLPFDEVSRLASHVETTGWDGLWYADHFMPSSSETNVGWPEAWTTLAALASITSGIRLGTLVTGNTYRHPAVLAKMVVTIDHISNGRVVLGLGSGWQENEHRAYGIPFYTVRERLERLNEACQIIKSLFVNQRTDFEGSFYTLNQATLEPKPVQSPLPLMVGGGGEKLTLRIAAEHADEWNVWGDVAILRRKMRILDDHCREVGRDPSEIQRSAVALLYMSDDESYVKSMKTRDKGMPSIVGTPSEVKDVVAELESIGVNELIVPDFTFDKDNKLKTLDTFIRVVAGR